MLKSSNEITPLEIVLQTVYEAIIDRVMSSQQMHVEFYFSVLKEKQKVGWRDVKFF